MCSKGVLNLGLVFCFVLALPLVTFTVRFHSPASRQDFSLLAIAIVVGCFAGGRSESWRCRLIVARHRARLRCGGAGSEGRPTAERRQRQQLDKDDLGRTEHEEKHKHRDVRLRLMGLSGCREALRTADCRWRFQQRGQRLDHQHREHHFDRVDAFFSCWLVCLLYSSTHAHAKLMSATFRGAGPTGTGWYGSVQRCAIDALRRGDSIAVARLDLVTSAPP
uniref:Uncharacterized protein n=1 Tax=Anopheles farauti TaxID=69004 RepID=A0A182Q156_9DIPT